jgi:hypothetical protein
MMFLLKFQSELDALNSAADSINKLENELQVFLRIQIPDGFE